MDMKTIAEQADIDEVKWNEAKSRVTIHYTLPCVDKEKTVDRFTMEIHDEPPSSIKDALRELRTHVANIVAMCAEERRLMPQFLEVRGVKWHTRGDRDFVGLSVNYKTNHGNVHFNTPFCAMEKSGDDEDEGAPPLPDAMIEELGKLIGGVRSYLAGQRGQPSLFDQADAEAEKINKQG